MKTRFMVVAAGLVLSMAASSASAFEYSWYDDLGYWNDPAMVASVNCNTTISYTLGYSDAGNPAQVARINTYLANANARGMKVILGCEATLHDVHAGTQTWTQFTSFINTFNANPAVKGWYLFDEPGDTSLRSDARIAYNIIKGATNPKTVYAAFNGPGVDAGMPVAYSSANPSLNTYDVMMYDSYPFGKGDPEFMRLESVDSWWGGRGWKALCGAAMAQASLANKPFINILQAFKRVPDGRFGDWWRLPTYNEERFMTFWSIAKGNAGVSFWAMDALDRGKNVAYPTDAYPGTGTQWKTNVALPIGNELAQLQYALGNGPSLTHLTGSNSIVESNLYYDSRDGKYYVVAVDTLPVSNSPWFTIPSYVGSFSAAIRLDGSGSCPINNGMFFDSFSSYGVKTYWLMPSGRSLSAVPEPTSMALLLTGGVAALWLFWRRKRRAAV